MSTSHGSGAEPALSQRHQRRDDFVDAVIALCEDKGTRADLRSGLGRPLEQCGRMHRTLAWRVPEDSYGERAHYAVASLIADRPREVRETHAAKAALEKAPGADGTPPNTDPTRTPAWHQRPNLGTSLAHAVRAGMKEDSAESHLRLLTRQSFAAVHPRLPSLLTYVQVKGADIDWAVLLEDLARWDADRDRVATRWLQSFYRTLHTPRPTAPTNVNDDTQKSEAP